MPTTLYPTIRYRILDKCFQQKGRRWTQKELSEKCGEALREDINTDQPNPSRRTTMEDIRMMKSGILGYTAPIVYDRKEKGYYYSDSDFSVAGSPLNTDDWKLLQQAATILKQFRGFSQLLDIENIIQKIEREWPNNNNATNKSVLIQFDQTMENSGQYWLEPLLKAIEAKEALDINYHPFDFDQPYRSIFSPYLLKEYNHRWFLVGWSHQEKRIEMRGLDRMLDVAVARHRFHQAPRFDPNTYFNLIIGVTMKEGWTLTTVRILARPGVAKYIKTKKLHHSQRLISETAEGSIFEYRLIPNYELQTVLLGFGETIKVLEPLSLQEVMVRRLRAGVSWYE
jgi:predicted DNA-binding transcriptional regulator YafY